MPFFLNYRIKKISNLESLTKLDVLDLHGNKVCQIHNNIVYTVRLQVVANFGDGDSGVGEICV